jgi:hypothetical protein
MLDQKEAHVENPARDRGYSENISQDAHRSRKLIHSQGGIIKKQSHKAGRKVK